jgi:hypothetical protein
MGFPSDFTLKVKYPNYFNMLSDKADEIRKLDRDHYKHYTDKQILEELLDDKIQELKGEKEGE